jgi:hypothetical protein
MYPSSITPPTTQQIFDANPQIFTTQSDGSGDFISCMDSINGNLVYVNGNHDITVTEQEINSLFANASKKNKQVRCINCSKTPKNYSSGIICGKHGHWHSMVCRPYKKESLPIGYYMTRAGMQNIVITQKDLPPLNVLAVQELISYNNLTFAQAMLTFQANQLGFNNINDLIFTMPDGTTISADLVADKFKDLSINSQDFLRVDIGGSLNVNAVADLHETKHKILVMGHTHIKELYTNKNPLGDKKRNNQKKIQTFSSFSIPLTTYLFATRQYSISQPSYSRISAIHLFIVRVDTSKAAASSFKLPLRPLRSHSFSLSRH